ncbi:Protein N-acetyltransferase, RimJ/RimL family [Andreprevotia lacus DSM 23236]|jgi:RimJ/RimL family protein N-acetyltransferase|uniref:Protein N-acetyltransferase, RimJ/RimL family n=1 Tax=Andreprevotia lacus DSM 23236 TaxID=1121001 RepID=A0A1W1XUD5_9NEIS|nr:GNAT family protein [Andreprevotia lacus]SMC27475.1 Protein N-acetyltransferase, RimJ/RimL family [Andreprevotia lacus DSM 23236]
MPHDLNEYGQPVGPLLPGWTPPTPPERRVLSGHGCRLEPLDAARHADDLWQAYNVPGQPSLWTYLAAGPFASAAEVHAWTAEMAAPSDPLMYAIIDDASGKALGVAGYLRIMPASGSIEVGHLTYSPALQRNRLATAAMVLMMEYAFALGYRRYEWKCNALNAPSCRAAERLGFLYEGTFRQATVVKGRSRDTAWYSILDSEWPALHAAFQQWLAPDNFDADGQQRAALSALTRAALAALR